MNSKDSYVIIFKNDAVGDLTQSLKAINKIIKIHTDKKIIIYLSERSYKYQFLINSENIEFKKVNYNLKLSEKINIFFYLFKNKITNIYILTPKNFYFYLPVFFKKIKFYGLCINGSNNYKRPYEYLRKFLYRYVVNDRSAVYKREHTTFIQEKLVNNNSNNNNITKPKAIPSKILLNNLPQDYIYFHLKKNIIKKLSWSLENLNTLFNELLKNYDYLIITQDIENDINQSFIRKTYNYIDFKNNEIIIKNSASKIILFDNIEGVDLYYTISNSSKILAFHGMMTNLGSIEKKKIIDMWFCEIKNYTDYKNYRNAFYEFKPKYKGYDFIIPSKNIFKTIKKLKYSLIK